jgi:hypothetical protein
MKIVTGPSLMSATFISAPKVPVAIGLPNKTSKFLTKLWYNGIAFSGAAALIKLGRFPFL